MRVVGGKLGKEAVEHVGADVAYEDHRVGYRSISALGEWRFTFTVAPRRINVTLAYSDLDGNSAMNGKSSLAPFRPGKDASAATSCWFRPVVGVTKVRSYSDLRNHQGSGPALVEDLYRIFDRCYTSL